MYEEILRAFLQNARQQGGIGRTGGFPDPNGSSSNMPMAGGTMGGAAPAPMPQLGAENAPPIPANFGAVGGMMPAAPAPVFEAERPQSVQMAMGGPTPAPQMLNLEQARPAPKAFSMPFLDLGKIGEATRRMGGSGGFGGFGNGGR